jgi:hypothetical protein
MAHLILFKKISIRWWSACSAWQCRLAHKVMVVPFASGPIHIWHNSVVIVPHTEHGFGSIHLVPPGIRLDLGIMTHPTLHDILRILSTSLCSLRHSGFLHNGTRIQGTEPEQHTWHRLSTGVPHTAQGAGPIFTHSSWSLGGRRIMSPPVYSLITAQWRIMVLLLIIRKSLAELIHGDS